MEFVKWSINTCKHYKALHLFIHTTKKQLIHMHPSKLPYLSMLYTRSTNLTRHVPERGLALCAPFYGIHESGPFAGGVGIGVSHTHMARDKAGIEITRVFLSDLNDLLCEGSDSVYKPACAYGRPTGVGVYNKKVKCSASCSRIVYGQGQVGSFL